MSGLAPDAGPATIAAATMAGSLTLFGFATAHPHPVAIAVGAAPAVTAAASVLVLGRWLEASSRPWRLRVPAKIPLVALLALAGVLSLARGGAASAADGGDGSTSRVVGGRVAEMATAVVGAGPVAQR
ncbi:MAG: hypothetical protein OEY23_14600 [Acidimicrobiia bacterium]|nr:hypothetical protein [Acidimicrobiia bacterium]